MKFYARYSFPLDTRFLLRIRYTKKLQIKLLNTHAAYIHGLLDTRLLATRIYP